MRTLFTLLIFSWITSLTAQLRMINPTIFPFGASDMQVFADGSAYFATAGSPFFIRVSDIHQPERGKVEIIKTVPEITEFYCRDVLHCIGRGRKNGKTTAFRTSDGGISWQEDRALDIDYPTHFVEPFFWIRYEPGLHELLLSTNQGRSWTQYKPGFSLVGNPLRYLGKETNVAYFYNSGNDTVYQFTPNRVRAFFKASDVVGTSKLQKLMPTSAGFIAVQDSGEVSLISNNLTQKVSLFNGSGSLSAWGHEKDAVFLFFSEDSTLVLTNNGGQSVTIKRNMEKSGFGSKYRNYHRNTFFTTSFVLGDWLEMDMITGQAGLAGHNKYPRTTMHLEPVGENHFLIIHSAPFSDSSKAVVLDGTGKKVIAHPLFTTKARLAKGVTGEQVNFSDSLRGFIKWNPFGMFSLTKDGGHSWQHLGSDTTFFPITLVGHSGISEDGQCPFFTKGDDLHFLDDNLNTLETVNNSKAASGKLLFKDCQEGLILLHNELWHTANRGKAHTTLLTAGQGERFVKMSQNDQGYFVLSTKSLYHSPQINGTFKQISTVNTPSGFSFFNVQTDLPENIMTLSNYRFHFSRDSGSSFQSALFPSNLGSFEAVRKTSDTTLLLGGGGGFLARLKILDSLVIVDSASGFTAIGWGNDTNTVGLPAPEKVQNIAFFPNPAQKHIILQFENPSPRTVKIFDFQGRLQLTRQVSSERVKLPIAKLPGGMYVLQVHLPQGETRAMKFLKLE